jgi:hypothetical protein
VAAVITPALLVLATAAGSGVALGVGVGTKLTWQAVSRTITTPTTVLIAINRLGKNEIVVFITLSFTT